MKNHITSLLILLVTCFTTTPLISQIVTSSADDGSIGTLRQQISIATPGSTISFASTITEVTLSSELIVDKNLTIQGNTSSNTTISGGDMVRIFRIVGGTVTLNHLTLTNGVAANGGAIFNESNLVVNDCMITDCIANGPSGSGGGIFNDTDANLTINNSVISFNTSNRAGGGIEDKSGADTEIVLNMVELSDNNTGMSPATNAPGNGGGLHITGSGDALVTNCIIKRNRAALEGGGLWNGTGTMMVSSCTIENNSAAGDAANEGGGGLFNAGGTLIVEGSTISTNTVTGTAASGGGILNDMGTLTVNNTLINGNVSVRAGGGIEDNSMAGTVLTLNNVQLLNNNTASAPGNGGGLHITGPGNSMITECLVTGNLAAAEGGGLWNGTGIMEVSNSIINNNNVVGNGANQGGGGLFNAGGTLVVMDCTVSGNTTSGTATSGGGILNDMGTLTVMGTEISNNTAIRAGGGIEDNSMDGGMLTLTEVEFLSNHTGSLPGNGGGLHITGPGNSLITDCTVIDNTAASEGGGLWNGTGMMTITACTIRDNKASGIAADNGGGGLFNNGGTMMVNGNTLVQNNWADGAAGSGGGLLSTDGNVVIENTTFLMNSANRAGGAIEIIDGDLTFSSSSMMNNDVNGTSGMAAPGNGGGIHITGNDGLVTITDAMISGNEAASEGGGVWNQSGTTMTISMTTIDQNLSFGDAMDNGGAGCFNNGGILNISNSTISNNRDEGTNGSGAGIHNITTGEVNILLTTVSGNNSNQGAGIYHTGTSMYVNASTIAFNQALNTGGGIESMNVTRLKNTIVSSNMSASGMDVSGNLVSEDYNLIAMDDLDVFTAMTNDIEGVDADLAPLDLNGNVTATHQLNNGSAAYNAGNPDDLFNDQNNQPIFGGRRDIGADESQVVLSSLDNVSIEESGISVFPNPTQGKLSIEIPEEFGSDVILEVYEASTSKLLHSINTQDAYHELDMASYANGTYVLRMTSGQVSTSQLVIKVD